MERKPRILISGSTTDSKSVTAIMASVRATGAEPVLMANHGERFQHCNEAALRACVQADIASADGVIIMGNNSDIDPRLYSAQKHEKTKSEAEDPATLTRGAYETLLVEAALQHKKPLLGVCAGMQRINVVLGGDLHQHIPELFRNPAAPNAPEDNRHAQNTEMIAPYIPVQRVRVEPGSQLAEIGKGISTVYTPDHKRLAEGVVMENSMHHQAVKTLGKGLRAAAYSIEPDRPDLHIVEAIEACPEGPLAKQFVMGVQWHPEFGASELSAHILQRFTEESRAYAVSHTRQAADNGMHTTVESIEPAKRGKLGNYEAAPGSWAAYVKARAMPTISP